jgi:hypothetical protein
VVLQRGDDGSLSLEKFSDAVGRRRRDEGEQDQIVFTSKLSELSPVVAAIEAEGFRSSRLKNRRMRRRRR